MLTAVLCLAGVVGLVRLRLGLDDLLGGAAELLWACLGGLGAAVLAAGLLACLAAG